MPEDIAEVIAQAYIELPGDHPVVAVRSSATAEDLPGLSFAGQQETFLNIHGLAGVLEAVQRCWASLWTARAIGYRCQHGIDQNAVSLAVVVQTLVHAEASGILFTANPVSGRRDQVVISASWGLGEAIVGGLVTPDTLVVDKASGRVLNRETAEKQVMTVLLESSTAEHPVPETMSQVPALSDQQTAELNALGADRAALWILMDIEWAWAEGSFSSCRPSRSLPCLVKSYRLK
jgi:pyruvate,water dikinase